MHGIAGPRSAAAATSCSERVGLTEAADRRVGGYSGGMKRRLDLALALVHDPRILFLDEPTTGLDVQSRTALWEEVARLAAEQGVTVFLTTQYLEEADQLADRVGIIDHGRIVAEGTPEALKAEIGRPTVEARPGDRADRAASRAASSASASRRRPRTERSPCASRDGVDELADDRPRPRRRGRRGSPSSTCTRRASTTSSSPRPGAGSRAPATERGETERADAGRDRAGTAAARGRPRRHERPLIQVGYLAQRSVLRTVRQPIMIVPALVFPLILLAVNACGLDAATEIPGFPTDTYITFALAFAFMQGAMFATNTAGTTLAEDIAAASSTASS